MFSKGDLAEVALLQAPRYDNTVSVGMNGNWNSSFLPRWYFLKSNEKLEFTTAEIRGDVDGLTLANAMDELSTKVPTLRLSQILYMYYSAHGLFNPSVRACNRQEMFKTAVPRSTMIEQVTLQDERMELICEKQRNFKEIFYVISSVFNLNELDLISLYRHMPLR